jgi:hypothetical protein
LYFGVESTCFSPQIGRFCQKLSLKWPKKYQNRPEMYMEGVKKYEKVTKKSLPHTNLSEFGPLVTVIL